MPIEVGDEDQRDELLEEIDITNKQCKERHETLSDENQELEEKHEKEEKKLAGATVDENNAAVEAEPKSTERKKFESHLLQSGQSCNTKVKTLDSENCGMTN